MTEGAAAQPEQQRAEREQLLLICEAEYGWTIGDFIARTRRVYPPLLAERDAAVERAVRAERELAELREQLEALCGDVERGVRQAWSPMQIARFVRDVRAAAGSAAGEPT